MIEGADHYPKLIVQELKGLNERMRYSNPDISEFDFLRNCIPTQAGSLSKMNGCKLYDTFSPSVASPILGITQTFDSAGNIIVQCRDAVYVISENELFGISTPATALTPYTPPVFGEITAVAATNPAQVTTGVAHSLTTGDWVVLSGFTDGTFSVAINGTFQVTVLSATVFTVVSNCTVAPTNYSGTIFTETVDPAYNGDDELYPEALFAFRMLSTVRGAAYGTGATSYTFDYTTFCGSGVKRYALNPDGSNSAFADYMQIGPGHYRISGWGRMSGPTNMVGQFFLLLTGASGSYTETFDADEASITANENIFSRCEINVVSTTPMIITPQLFLKLKTGAAFNCPDYPTGFPPTGFTVDACQVKITKLL